jgi:predicted signal transduction protein with EAL and GGDEF domain
VSQIAQIASPVHEPVPERSPPRNLNHGAPEHHALLPKPNVSDKVDQSFVQGIVEDVTDAPVLTAIIGLGMSLNRRVIAAGVETGSQLAFLRAQHCPEAQGHLFSPPIGANELTDLLGNWRGVPAG